MPRNSFQANLRSPVCTALLSHALKGARGKMRPLPHTVHITMHLWAYTDAALLGQRHMHDAGLHVKTQCQRTLFEVTFEHVSVGQHDRSRLLLSYRLMLADPGDIPEFGGQHLNHTFSNNFPGRIGCISDLRRYRFHLTSPNSLGRGV